MAHKYAAIAFTDTVRQVQQQQGSRNAYAAMDQGEDYNYLLSENEAQFIQARDSFYMASVSETGWPYVQHRGGAKGFLQVLDPQTIAFADFKGNRQYVSTGNFQGNDRVSLILMDYPNRTRLKILGRVSIVTDDWELLARLEQAHYRAVVERAFVITIEAFDWNCPQHITPRYSEAEMATVIDPLLAELEQLKRQSESPVATLPTTLSPTAKALNIAEQQTQIEAFSADSSESGKPFTARLLKSATEVQVSKDQSLLDAILDAGIEHPHSCKTGACRSCAVKVIEGEVDHKDQCLSPSERKTQLCPCVSRSHSDLLLLDL